MGSFPLGKVFLCSDFVQLDQRKETFGFSFFFVDSPPTLLVGKSSCPWQFLTIGLGHTDFLGLQLSVSSYRSPEKSRFILCKLRASKILKTTGALATIKLSSGNIFKF